VNKYYVSFNNFLCGYFVQVIAEHEEEVRIWANKTLGRLWCSVYQPEQKNPYFDESKIIGKTVYLTIEEGEVYDNY
jgi:hypothetical protein